MWYGCVCACMCGVCVHVCVREQENDLTGTPGDVGVARERLAQGPAWEKEPWHHRIFCHIWVGNVEGCSGNVFLGQSQDQKPSHGDSAGSAALGWGIRGGCRGTVSAWRPTPQHWCPGSSKGCCRSCLVGSWLQVNPSHSESGCLSYILQEN